IRVSLILEFLRHRILFAVLFKHASSISCLGIYSSIFQIVTVKLVSSLLFQGYRAYQPLTAAPCFRDNLIPGCQRTRK
uniref:Uncharacterized protein n=1 Tax=Ciona savignyi TaxID=51511 RepID=H2Y8F6_CIOSA